MNYCTRSITFFNLLTTTLMLLSWFVRGSPREVGRSCSSVLRRGVSIRVRGGDTGYIHRAYLAVGSNMGDRFENIHKALQLLCQEENGQSHPSTKLTRTSFLRETYPMYIEDQPNFLNGAVQVETNLPPREMLKKIKSIEMQMGRDFGSVRNGPRPIDIDILLYETINKNGSLADPLLVNEADLAVPHASIHEREFVLEPLIDVVGRHTRHPTLNKTLGQLLDLTRKAQPENSREMPSARVLPLRRDRLLYLNRTIIMGILNVTPDSFSDGGQWSVLEKAVDHALEMVRQGADVIDIGGESTRPGAKEIEIPEELGRVIPVIERLRSVSDVPISIDTRHSQVAEAAVAVGADIVNDVSGGMFDNNMIPTVAALGVPMVFMHMRGIPETMQTMVEYDDIVQNVVESLCERSTTAELSGISRWLHVADPGIGFAKDLHGNLRLLKDLAALRSGVMGLPILLGPSRKGFISRLAEASNPEDRDPGTISACVTSLCLDTTSNDGCSIIRVHNIPACKQAILVMEAIRCS